MNLHPHTTSATVPLRPLSRRAATHAKAEARRMDLTAELRGILDRNPHLREKTVLRYVGERCSITIPQPRSPALVTGALQLILEALAPAEDEAPRTWYLMAFASRPGLAVMTARPQERTWQLKSPALSLARRLLRQHGGELEITHGRGAQGLLITVDFGAAA